MTLTPNTLPMQSKLTWIDWHTMDTISHGLAFLELGIQHDYSVGTEQRASKDQLQMPGELILKTTVPNK